MTLNDWTGTLGVALILLAYCSNIYGFFKKDGVLFFLLNTAGAGLACLASLLIPFYPFVVLEGVWFLVSAIGLIRVVQKSKS